MILIDSSVWIDFLQSTHSKVQGPLSELIRVPDLIGIPGPVIQEVLQGVQDDGDFQHVLDRLCWFPIKQPDTDTYLAAARLYRVLARKGLTIPPGDVMSAALAIQHECVLYTLDQHFERIRQHSSLRLRA